MTRPTAHHHSKAPKRRRWVFVLTPSLAMLLLSLLPQIYLAFAGNADWRFPYVYTRGDELAYAAYVNALIDGRPRRNDPFTGRDDHDNSHPESLFSIQFVPAYALALTARALNISTHTTFTLLSCLVGVGSILLLFWLLLSLTENKMMAATGSLFVLCLGSLLINPGPWRYLYDPNAMVVGLPFMRRYVPAFPFPFYIAFCAIIVYMLTKANRRMAMICAFLASLLFAVLVFSYFYLWTAAAAWLLCLGLLWLIARPVNWQWGVILLGGVAALCALSLAPYFYLLFIRSPTLDSADWVITTRWPDFLHKPELLGLAVVAFLLWGTHRGLVNFKDHIVLLITSLCIFPVVLFNQQVVTGRLMQPYHYDFFVTNYGVLLAIVLTVALIWRLPKLKPRWLSNKLLIFIAIFAFGWGAFETTLRLRRYWAEYKMANDASAVALKLAELGHGEGGAVDTDSVILVTDPWVAEYLPTVAPQPVLWGYHMIRFSGGSLREARERFAQYLYYTGVNPTDLYDQQITLDERRKYVFNFLNREMQIRPTTPAEARAAALNEYSNHTASFRERAANPTLSYLVTSTHENADLSNLDRWYKRDAGERFGRFTLYRLKLRP